MAETKFIISAKDETKAALTSAKNSLSSLDRSVSDLSANMVKFASFAGLAALTAKVAQFSASCVRDFAAGERAMLRLQGALGDGTAFNKAVSLMDTLSRSYVGSKDDVEGVISSLAALGKSTDQIDAITRASINLSNTTGQDLNSSYLLLADTFEGKVSAKLKKLIPELGDLSEAQLSAGGATDLINEKLQAMTDKLSEGTAQKITNLAESFNTLKDNVGQDAANLMSPMIEWLEKVITRTNDAITASRLHQKVMKEGANAAIEDQIQDKQNQLGNAVAGQKADLAGAGLGSFSNWLKQQRAASPERYSEYGAAANQKYNLEYSKQVAEITKRSEPVMQALQNEINVLTEQLKKNTEQLVDPKPTPVVAAGGGGAGTTGTIGQSGMSFFVMNGGVPLGLPDLNTVPQGVAAAPTGSTDIGMSGIGVMNDVIGPFVERLGGVIESFSMIQQIMDPVGIIIQGIMDVLAPIIEELLTPLIGILRIFGQLIGMFIAPALRMLTPVITFITKAFIFLYNYALVPVQNFFITLIQTIGNFFIKMMNGVIGALNKIPFVNIKKLGELDLSGQKAKTISMDDIMAAGGSESSGGSQGGGSGGSGSSYTGSKTVTVNIFFDRSYVNGDSRDIALMLRQEIRSAEALGY